MSRLVLLAFALVSTLGIHVSGQATIVVAFENARIIIGDGRAPIEGGTILVDGTRITGVGRTGSVQVPAGATRISLAGKTVIPALIDTHTHLSTTRDALSDDLRRRAYWGVAAALSMGTDPGDLPFEMRAQAIPGAALYRTAGRGITAPEPGRSDVPYWVTSVAQARTAVGELATRRVDIVKIWV